MLTDSRHTALHVSPKNNPQNFSLERQFRCIGVMTTVWFSICLVSLLKILRYFNWWIHVFLIQKSTLVCSDGVS